ncbi:MAG: FAD-dependent oxidoreductase [Sedimentisphaerales bacterium]|nr:FAD-dependent oxidoreductase [Sedimentisphaerales bacterium]
MTRPAAIIRSTLAAVIFAFSASVLQAHTVLVEAESFGNLGGWLIDQQFADQTGSPFLLAHGLGTPVEDAATKIQLPQAGKYRVFVRTRDWVAPWNAPGAPGRFQLLIDGKALPTTFGTEGALWHWQDGGAVDIPNPNVTIALHDLAGFDGRCDAILLASDPDFTPPNNETLPALRRKLLGLADEPQDAGAFDLVVVGGGIAGTCSAITAARLGCKVALIQDRPVLGGNNSSEVRVHLNGRINLPPYPALGDVVKEIDPGFQGNARPAAYYDDEKKLRVVRDEKNLHLFLSTRACNVEKQGDRITAVIANDIRTSKQLRFEGKYFADCTGDGTLGFLAGADFRMGRESKAETGEALAPETPDKMTMGASVQWYSSATDRSAAFPDCPWALQFDEETCHYLTRGDWNWETGLNRNQITEFEFIRDYALRAAFGNWAYLKNKSARTSEYAGRKLDWVAYVAGKRESRRLLGDVILRQQDIEGRKIFPDAFVTTTWTIDLHYPDPENTKHFPGEEFRSIAKHVQIKPYPIPYRCFYSRNIENLFMAGRDISVTHVALGTVRVMRTCGMMGEVIGMAASLCKEHDTTPRGVYENHLDELKKLAKQGAGKPIDRDDHDFKVALENGRLANEGLRRCRKFVSGWLSHADPKTGLIPRNLTSNKDIWNAQDSAADNYPFMVLAAAVTDRPLFDGTMLDMLKTETELTSRIGAMPDTFSFTKQAFADETPDLNRIIFGASEYVKDGLLPLTEWLGQSPWSERMIAILDDIWNHAPVDTPFGKIPSTSREVNGEMLQTLSRVYYMTGESKYLDWAVRLGDYYLLADRHPTRHSDALRLRDHGCEILSGLCELYAAVAFARPEKKKEYRRPIHEMLDRVLEVGRNDHGLFYNSINPKTGDHDKALADTWGYNLNGFYTVFLIDRTEAYRQAVLKALANINDHYKNYDWESGSADGYADAIESALNLYNREPVDSAAQWIDTQTKKMWAIQKPDGVIEGWHGDGNFARTTIMYCLWKTAGLTIQPWRDDVVFGAVLEPGTLKIAIRADKDWKGKLIFDAPRHAAVMHLPLDWPRINQFPEWFTAHGEKRFDLYDLTASTKKTLTGDKLTAGLELTLAAKEEKHLLIKY